VRDLVVPLPVFARHTCCWRSRLVALTGRALVTVGAGEPVETRAHVATNGNVSIVPAFLARAAVLARVRSAFVGILASLEAGPSGGADGVPRVACGTIYSVVGFAKRACVSGGDSRCAVRTCARVILATVCISHMC